MLVPVPGHGQRGQSLTKALVQSDVRGRTARLSLCAFFKVGHQHVGRCETRLDDRPCRWVRCARPRFPAVAPCQAFPNSGLAMNTLQEALTRKTVDELKALTALLPGAAPSGRKDALIATVLGRLDAAGLRAVWDGLDKLQRLAVAESLHTPGGLFDGPRFRAKYGEGPAFNRPSDDPRRRFDSRPGAPTSLRLLLHPDAQQRHLYRLPADLHDTLRGFVAQPAAARLVGAEALPDSVDGLPLTLRCTEREAIVDLAVLLRLADQGKLQVSDKTSQPSASTLRLLADKLSGGDFYPPGHRAAPRPGPPDDQGERLEEAGPIKAFGWPLLLQAAGLVQRNGSKSALSPSGRKALGAAPADLLRMVWRSWLGASLLDEFSRIDQIKGQKSKGRVMTAVAPRRAAIDLALQACPLAEWVTVDELARFMQATGTGFEVAHDPWKLYIVDPQHGSLGYDGSNGWDILQLRYLLCLLFEYAAVLGLIDVAFVDPQDGHRNYGGLWAGAELEFLSRYDGLLRFRVNALGAYVLGLSPAYTPSVALRRTRLSVLPSLRVTVVDGELAPEEALVLETWADPISDMVWLLDRQKALAAVENGHDTAELGEFLRGRHDQALPEAVGAFIRNAQQRGRALRVIGPALLIGCLDAETAARIAAHPETAGLCAQAGARQLVVRSEHEQRFRAAVRLLGLGMSA